VRCGPGWSSAEPERAAAVTIVTGVPGLSGMVQHALEGPPPAQKQVVNVVVVEEQAPPPPCQRLMLSMETGRAKRRGRRLRPAADYRT
jgi:hypothetical protein